MTVIPLDLARRRAFHLARRLTYIRVAPRKLMPVNLSDVTTIGPLQTKILFTLWRHPAINTVRLMQEHLNQRALERGEPVLAYTTYLTVMRNLNRRGFLKQDKATSERAHTFTPLITESTYKDGMIKHTLDNVFGGDKALFVAAVTSITTPAITSSTH